MTSDEVRTYQRAELLAFLLRRRSLFSGRTVLDYGCGAAPYRAVVEAAGGHWSGFNRSFLPGGPAVDVGDGDPLDSRWNVILCTQVLQYVPDVPELLAQFRRALKPSGRLVLTYQTNWPEVEPHDLWRFTRTGIEELLVLKGLTVEAHERIGELPFGDRETLPLGGGVVARR